MARKVIIDCDPGIDDAVALSLALFDPRLEVLAVTATAGNVRAKQASRNVQAIIEQIDPPRLPRLGAANPADGAPSADGRQLHGEDGLGNAGFEISALHHQHPSEKIITDAIRAAPGQVTIICLGPLTNIAAAFRRDRGLSELVNRIIMVGGTVHGVGNVTPAAEFNMYYDPDSAREVFRSPTTKTLIPLDVTRQVVLTMGWVDQLPRESTRIGALLRRIVPYLFRTYHQTLGQEGIHLHDCTALIAALHPELFETREMPGDVETCGELTMGATVFDRRPTASERANLEVAMAVNATGVINALVRGLHAASGGI